MSLGAADKSGARVDLESINEKKVVGVWVRESIKESHASFWHGEEILQTLDKRSFVTLYRAYV